MIHEVALSAKSSSGPGRERLLRTALLGNAAFSATTGAAMTLFPNAVAGLAGIDVPVALRVLGLGLLAFAGVVAWTGIRNRLRAWLAVLISFADLLWVAGSAVLVLVSPPFMHAGSARPVLLVAFAVLGFGVLQLLGVRRLLRETSPHLGAWRHCLSVNVDAPPDAMWRVVSDLGAISRFVPTLVNSALVDDVAPREGAVRVCADTSGRQWEEVCTAFEPRARRLRLRFRTEADNFPYPMKEMHGGWKVEPHREGSRVMVWWSMTPTLSMVPWLLVALMGRRLDKAFPTVIERMAAHAGGRPVEPTSRRSLSVAPC